MAIPASFLTHLEQHGCFSGCYGSESDMLVCLDPSQPLQPQTVISCRDCFAKFGILRSLLSNQCSTQSLATDVSRHLLGKRNFTWAVSGYYTNGPGMWFRGAFVASGGLFLLDGDRSRQLGSDLDQLMLAFKHGIVQPTHSLMTDPKQYTLETVYLRFIHPFSSITCRQDLLASPHYRAQPSQGFQRATMAIFQPLAPAPQPTAKPVSAGPPKLGSICPKCKAEVKVRSLLKATFTGCLC
jgi:hypothetical protein